MNGGSFNYLYSKYAHNLLDDTEAQDDLLRMAVELAKLPGGERAAKRAESILEAIREVQRLTETIDERMADLRRPFCAVEGWHSCDYSREDALAVLEQYNAERDAGRV